MAKKMKRVTLPYDLYCNVQMDSFEGKSLKEVSSLIQETEVKCKEAGFSNVVFEIDYGMFQEDCNNFILKGERLETDAEERHRIKTTENQRRLREKLKLDKKIKEKEYYLKLKKKFEGK